MLLEATKVRRKRAIDIRAGCDDEDDTTVNGEEVEVDAARGTARVEENVSRVVPRVEALGFRCARCRAELPTGAAEFGARARN